MLFMNQEITQELMPESDWTVRQWLIEAFHDNRVGIKAQLALDAISKIHLSADMWTSPNQQALLAVVAHFVDSENRYVMIPSLLDLNLIEL